MNTTAEIYLWGTRIGAIHQDQNKAYASFAYDPKNKWLNSHQMTVNGKKDQIDLYDLLKAGESMGIRESICKKIISDINIVVADFEKYAEAVRIRENTFAGIKNVLIKNRIDV